MEIKKNELEIKTWKEFRESGLLFIVNMALMPFGWKIVGSKNGEFGPAKCDKVYTEEQIKDSISKVRDKFMRRHWAE